MPGSAWFWAMSLHHGVAGVVLFLYWDGERQWIQSGVGFFLLTTKTECLNKNRFFVDKSWYMFDLDECHRSYWNSSINSQMKSQLTMNLGLETKTMKQTSFVAWQCALAIVGEVLFGFMNNDGLLGRSNLTGDDGNPMNLCCLAVHNHACLRRLPCGPWTWYISEQNFYKSNYFGIPQVRTLQAPWYNKVVW